MKDIQKISIDNNPIRMGFLHPGEMGSALAKVARRNGATTWWASEGRSISTASRAAVAGIEDVGALKALCHHCEIIISICPPHAAIDMAKAVAASGFGGIYVDANAISPGAAMQIAEIVEQSGAAYVDAAVVGAPPNGRHDTVIYFSGEAAHIVAKYFKAEAVSVELLGASRSHASAVKICHSAIHKGQLAMLLATLAAAEHYGVKAHLESLLARHSSTRSLSNEIPEIARRATKGWRFAGEMLEVADTFAMAGLPPELHRGASEVFRRCPAPGSVDQNKLSTDNLIRMLLDHDIRSD